MTGLPVGGIRRWGSDRGKVAKGLRAGLNMPVHSRRSTLDISRGMDPKSIPYFFHISTYGLINKN